jgi:hypothetical protein
MWGALSDERTGLQFAIQWLKFNLSYIVTDGLSASLSWCWAPNEAHDQILISLFDNYFAQ